MHFNYIIVVLLFLSYLQNLFQLTKPCRQIKIKVTCPCVNDLPTVVSCNSFSHHYTVHICAL